MVASANDAIKPYSPEYKRGNFSLFDSYTDL